MFNQLTPAEVVTAVGATVQAAARSDDRASDFERDQLLSAYSATRHLAVELATYAPVLERYVADVVARLHAAEVADAPLAAALQEAAERLDAGAGAAALGAAVADVLTRLRDAGDPAARALQHDLRTLTRRLADDEVDLLADGLARR